MVFMGFCGSESSMKMASEECWRGRLCRPIVTIAPQLKRDTLTLFRLWAARHGVRKTHETEP